MEAETKQREEMEARMEEMEARMVAERQRMEEENRLRMTKCSNTCRILHRV